MQTEVRIIGFKKEYPGVQLFIFGQLAYLSVQSCLFSYLLFVVKRNACCQCLKVDELSTKRKKKLVLVFSFKDGAVSYNRQLNLSTGV